jgi:hypothetical protein
MKNSSFQVRNRKVVVDIDILSVISSDANLVSVLPRKRKKALKKKLSKLLIESLKNYTKTQYNG